MNARREWAEAKKATAHYGPRVLRGAVIEVGHLVGLASILVIALCGGLIFAGPV
jgi:hypothetical protein